MPDDTTFHDALSRWAEASDGKRAQLVRVTAHDSGNRYTARPIAFNASNQTELVGASTLTVTNLAEPSDAGGSVPADTDALAVDAGGRWIVFIRQSSDIFPARIVYAQGGAAYTIRRQVATGAGTFADAPGASNLTAHNLAELSLGPGAAVDADTIVLVQALIDTGNPPTVRHVFDHPAYAKYLD